MLNDYGLNPAVAGSSKNIVVLAGRRSQWAGIKYAPETNFASISTIIGKKTGIRYYWHGIGVYVEQDRLGIFTNFVANASYAIHLKLSHKYNLSFGIAAGIKQVAISTSSINQNDPVIASRAISVIVPDFVPGVYLYSRKLIAGIAVKNIYKTTLDQGGKSIGTTGSRLYPNTYLMFGRKIISQQYDFIYVPSIQIQTTFTSIPAVQLNLMTYYRKKIGLGISYKSQNAIAAMIQFRITSDIVFGFAYDFTISKLRQAKGANATEVMFGFHSVMSSENYDRPTGATQCPKFEL